VPRLGLEPRTL